MSSPTPPPVLRPPQGALARIQWFFLLFSFFFIVTYLPQITTGPRPLTVKVLAMATLVALAVWWLRCYRRRSFPLVGLVLEAAAFLAAGLAVDAALKSMGLLYIAVNFRNLYGSTRRAVAFTVMALGCFLTAVVLSPRLGGPDQLEQFLQAVPGVPVLATITVLMARAMSRGERAAVRERTLASAATSMASARDRAGVEAAAAQAALQLLVDAPGASAAVRRPGDDAADGGPDEGPAGLVLPMAGRDGEVASLVVDVPGGRVPAEARDALEALAGAAGLVLANLALTEDLRVRAERDGLTGLVNRTELHTRLRATVGICEDGAFDGMSLSVLMIDLDGFKAVNDARGHAAGDAVLRVVASRLLHHVRGSDTVSRLGGDEFVVVLEHAADAPHRPAQIGQRLLAALAEPVDLGSGAPAAVGASIGIARWVPGESADQLLDRADHAMYQAKRSGRGRCCDAPAPEQAPAPGRVPTALPG